MLPIKSDKDGLCCLELNLGPTNPCCCCGDTVGSVKRFLEKAERPCASACDVCKEFAIAHTVAFCLSAASLQISHLLSDFVDLESTVA